jgi:KRAB domain-containing zinc finger protein
MVKHRRLAHGAKTFICTICEKGFTSIFALNKHLNVHSGLKPFKCVDCDYRSVRISF